MQAASRGWKRQENRLCPEAHGPADALNLVIKPTEDLDLQSSKRISSCCLKPPSLSPLSEWSQATCALGLSHLICV